MDYLGMDIVAGYCLMVLNLSRDFVAYGVGFCYRFESQKKHEMSN